MAFVMAIAPELSVLASPFSAPADLDHNQSAPPVIKQSENHSSVVRLRHGHQYYFTNRIDAHGNAAGINRVDVTFTDKGAFNNTEGHPEFPFTDDLKNRKYIINPHESVITVKSNPLYAIDKHPPKRGGTDISIKYETYYYLRTGDKWYGIYIDVHYQPYMITWCGDGVVDDYFDDSIKVQIHEECDPLQSSWKKSGNCDPTTCTVKN